MCGLSNSLGQLVFWRLSAGTRRRRLDCDLASDFARHLRHQRARKGPGRLRDGGDRRTRARARDRWLDHRQLELALDLFHQHPDRHHRRDADLELFAQPERGKISEARLDRPGSHVRRAGIHAVRARERSAVRLVRRRPHPVVHVPFDRRAGGVRLVDAALENSGRRSARLAAPAGCVGQHTRRGARREPVRLDYHLCRSISSTRSGSPQRSRERRS